jgi:hypothetical protein
MTDFERRLQFIFINQSKINKQLTTNHPIPNND